MPQRTSGGWFERACPRISPQPVALAVAIETVTTINPVFPSYQISRRNRIQTNRSTQAKRPILPRFVPAWLLQRANPAPEASGTTSPARFRAASILAPTQIADVSLGHEHQPRCTNGGGTPKRWMRSRIAANKSRGTATSASWNATYLACRTSFAPILISFSRSVVNRDSLTPIAPGEKHAFLSRETHPPPRGGEILVPYCQSEGVFPRGLVTPPVSSAPKRTWLLQPVDTTCDLDDVPHLSQRYADTVAQRLVLRLEARLLHGCGDFLDALAPDQAA